FDLQKSGRLDSNQRPHGPEPCALSQAELRPVLTVILVARPYLSTPTPGTPGHGSRFRRASFSGSHRVSTCAFFRRIWLVFRFLIASRWRKGYAEAASIC